MRSIFVNILVELTNKYCTCQLNQYIKILRRHYCLAFSTCLVLRITSNIFRRNIAWIRIHIHNRTQYKSQLSLRNTCQRYKDLDFANITLYHLASFMILSNFVKYWYCLKIVFLHTMPIVSFLSETIQHVQLTVASCMT